MASYVAAGLDFIALRLQPGKNVRAMDPIRIVSPGTDAQLPLRMMQIGAGAKVGITLYVNGEGRYRTGSFPDAPIDFTKLIWDYAQNRSNYQELSLAAMATANGRAFITEYADRPSFDARATPAGSGMTSNTGLAAAYRHACPAADEPTPLPPYDAGHKPPYDAGADATSPTRTSPTRTSPTAATKMAARPTRASTRATAASHRIRRTLAGPPSRRSVTTSTLPSMASR